METLNGVSVLVGTPENAEDVTVSVFKFDSNLSGTDTDSQTALDTLDAIDIDLRVSDEGGSWDFDQDDFTEDGTWRSLDLSGIVPVGTKFVTIEIHPTINAVSVNFSFRKNTAAGINFTQQISQVANVQCSEQFRVAVASDRTIQYNMGVATWSNIVKISAWKG